MNRGDAIQKYFNAYPNAEVLNNEDEMKERLTIMRQSVQDLRVAAVANSSIKELQECQALEHDLSMLMMVHEQKRIARRALAGV